MWFEQDLLTKRCKLLVEWFPSNALVCCLPVTANVECRQSPCCMTYKPLQDSAVETNRRTDLSFGVILDRTNLSLHGSDGSLNAAVGVAVSDWAFFVHDFCWDVRSSFVFDVNDARFLIAL